MKVRFELQSLFALGEGVHRLPIKCWRFTLVIAGDPANSAGVLFDGAQLRDDTSIGGGQSGTAQLVVGGVFANGQPVLIDQELIVTVPSGGFAQAVLMYEHIEP